MRARHTASEVHGDVAGQPELSGFASFAWNRTSSSDPAVPRADQLGLVAQAAVYVSAQWELLARYQWADVDVAGVPELSVVSAGVNWYLDGQRLRWATDLGWGINAVGVPFASVGAGWRADAPGRDGQVVLRSQVQMIF